MTDRQLAILQHALGVDKYGQGEMYRNHFCAGGEDETICRGGSVVEDQRLTLMVRVLVDGAAESVAFSPDFWEAEA